MEHELVYRTIIPSYQLLVFNIIESQMKRATYGLIIETVL